MKQDSLIQSATIRRDEITTAINALEKRVEDKITTTETKAKLVAWTAGTIMGIITTAAGLVATLSGLIKE